MGLRRGSKGKTNISPGNQSKGVTVTYWVDNFQYYIIARAPLQLPLIQRPRQKNCMHLKSYKNDPDIKENILRLQHAEVSKVHFELCLIGGKVTANPQRVDSRSNLQHSYIFE